MEIIIGKLSGFCNGVAYTIKQAEKILNENQEVYCLGEIVHNERVIKDLQERGMTTVKTIEEIPNNKKVIIRAHGELKETYEKANDKNIEVFDLTCGKIKVIRGKIETEKKDSFIIIIGKKNHPETLGIQSFAGKSSIIIENEEDIESLNKIIDKEKIYILSQTTFNSEKFDILVDKIKQVLKKKIKVDKTICDATRNRQQETDEISKTVDVMIIVGGKNSSNTKELEVVSKNNCNRVHLIQDYKDLEIVEINKEDKIGIMAGASTPKIVVDEIIKYLEDKYK